MRALILEISAMQFSQAARLRLFAIDRNRHLTLNSLGLRDRMNVSAAVRIPRDGEFLFGGKLLESVDSDISMHKRAKEVAGRLASRAFLTLHVGSVFARTPLFPPAVEGSPFVPAAEVFVTPYAAEEWPRAEVPPCGPLPQHLVENDYMGGFRVCGVPPVGGRISLFVGKWQVGQVVTADSFVLSVIKNGFQILLQNHFPGVIRKATVTPQDPKVILRIQEEIRDLISKDAIVQINDTPSLCLSPIFVIPKKSGDLRVILNLKEFNLFISTQHFRMETLNVILPQLSASDWAVSIDLKDAYLHVPIHPSPRRFLGFQFMGKTFQYKVLPFGLKDSPWVFTRVVATLVGHLRRLGLRLFYYLDNWLLVAESRVLLESHLRTTLQTVDSGPGVSCELGEVFPYPAETSVLSWGATSHFQVVGSTLKAQSVGSPGGDSGSCQGSFGYRPHVAEISRPPCQLRGPCPQLQAADEASSASSAVFHPLGRSTGQACSLEFRDQGFVQGVGLSFSPSRRETVLPASSVSSYHHGRVRSRVGGGGGSSPSPCVRGLVERGGLGPYQFSGIEGGSSSFAESRISCSGSCGSDSFRQHDGGVLHQSSGRNSFLIPVSAGLGPVGMVPSSENFSSRGSHSGSREHCSGFSLQGKIPSCRMGSESRRVSDDLSFVFSSSGDRLVCVSSQLPALEVLLSVPGCSGVEDRCSVVSLEGPSTVRISSFLSSPQDLGQNSPGRGRPSPGSSVLASETLVSSSPETLGGPSEDIASAEGPSGATHVFDSSPQGRKSSSFFMASFRQQGEEAGLSQRAAQFAAEALRQSTRDTYDSRLVPFRE